MVFGCDMILLLILSLLFRIIKIDFPLSSGFVWGDGTRDFLVANHILKYGERPIFGPFNLLFDSGIFNSPLYFYILSLMLAPFNHILTLSMVNIFLQLACIVLIYLIAKKLFDAKTAFIAVALFSFNPAVLQQSDFIWQPFLMQTVVLLALYFFIQKRLISFFLLSFAASIHNSAFPWIVVFFLYLPKKKIIWGLLILFLSLALFYSPIFLSAQFKGIDFSKETMIATSLNGYLNNFIANFREFFNIFHPYQNLMMVLLLSLAFVKRQRNLFLTIMLILAPFVFAAFFNKIRLHYLTLSLSAFSILAAEVFTSLTKKTHLFSRSILFILLLIIFTADFAFIKEIKSPLSNQTKINQLVFIITKELHQIQKQEGFKDINFFQVYSIALIKGPAFYYPLLDTILLVPLEDRLKQPLTKISDNAFNHVQTGGKKYLFVACHKFSDIDVNTCLTEFNKTNPGYQIVKAVYESNSIYVYLAKKS